MTCTIWLKLRDKSRSIYFRERQNVKNYHSYQQECNNRFPANSQCYKSKVHYSKGMHKMTERLLGFALYVRTKMVKMLSTLIPCDFQFVPSNRILPFTNCWSLNPRNFILHAWKDPLIFAELTHYLFIAPYDRIQRRTKVSIWKPLWPLKRFETILSNLPFMLYMLYPSDDFRSLPLNTCLANSIFRKSFGEYRLLTIHKRPKHNHVQNGGT